MHQYRAPFRELDTFFAVRSWVDCITNMSGFDLRQAQGRRACQWAALGAKAAIFENDECSSWDARLPATRIRVVASTSRTGGARPALMSVSGQNAKYSQGADDFRF